LVYPNFGELIFYYSLFVLQSKTTSNEYNGIRADEKGNSTDKGGEK
jgi:hypothetical protein